MRVLVLEDEAPVRNLVKTLLDDAGIESMVAATAREGIEAIEGAAAPFDAVVMDLMLPDLSGMDLVRRIRQTGLPIVMVTGLSREVVVEELLMESGIAGVLQKPFDADELVERVKVALNR